MSKISKLLENKKYTLTVRMEYTEKARNILNDMLIKYSNPTSNVFVLYDVDDYDAVTDSFFYHDVYFEG
jgi:hypothetical protein